MKFLATLPIHVDKTMLAIGLLVVGLLGIIALWKKRFAGRAEMWPIIDARVENVFLDVSSRGPNRRDVTHTVLAYAYSIGGSYYSGQIGLWAGERGLEAVEKEMVGQNVSVHYNPRKPDISIFLKHKVRGWMVVADRRISIWSWMGMNG
jgi:Protein of unknown function (DUF3592)